MDEKLHIYIAPKKRGPLPRKYRYLDPPRYNWRGMSMVLASCALVCWLVWEWVK